MNAQYILTSVATFIFCGAIAVTSNTDQASGKDASKRSWKWNQVLMYPGTKWCGQGHTAANYNDLGKHRETDKCCRAHDKCPRKVKGFRSKYGYFNWRPNTISECSCDDAFKNCLNAISSQASRGVKRVFFGIIKPPCIILKKKTERRCVKWRWFLCKKYKTETKWVAKLREN